MAIFACIGSRQCAGDHDVINLLDTVGEALAIANTVRSGGASGADEAWMAGAIRAHHDNIRRPRPEIFTAKVRHSAIRDHWGFEIHPDEIDPRVWTEAERIAAYHHPRWPNLSQFVRRLMTRNVLIVLGRDLDQHATAVMCWTPNGLVEGGSGQAMRIAQTHGIPIRNLQHPDVARDAARWAEQTLSTTTTR